MNNCEECKCSDHYLCMHIFQIIIVRNLIFLLLLGFLWSCSSPNEQIFQWRGEAYQL